VLSESDAAEIVGSDVTLDDADGCRYVGVSDGIESVPEVAVVIYETERAFQLLTKPVLTEPVVGVGDQAVQLHGFSASGKGAPGGSAGRRAAAGVPPVRVRRRRCRRRRAGRPRARQPALPRRRPDLAPCSRAPPSVSSARGGVRR